MNELLIYLSFVIGYSYVPTVSQNGQLPKFAAVERKYLPLAQKSVTTIVEQFKVVKKREILIICDRKRKRI
jgi:hypothetical protein